jgi:branched-subunit amino acid aminotransferase/4-amino-4-deoxychorismate lyase
MFLNFNGEVREAGEALLRADNRGFRYGDGLFETMLFYGSRVRLGKYHLERLFVGMRLLGLEFQRVYDLAMLEQWIGELCVLNGLDSGIPARVRLMVFRGGAGLYNQLNKEAGYCIEVSGLAGAGWGEEGFALGIFGEGRKVCDAYSGIKSNNYQLSTVAGMFAARLGLDDCLLLNNDGRVVETTMANIWWVRDGRFFTPPLSEGCVAGVMRRWLLSALPAAGYAVQEAPIRPEELSEVDEIFISNAIRGVQWVRDLSGQGFGYRLSAVIYDEIIPKIQV